MTPERSGPTHLESIAEIGHRIETGGPAPRPITYMGITFRSRLELAFAHHLTDTGVEWRYEPRVYGPSGSGYLPDFELLGYERPTFVELKPLIADADEAKRRMEVIWAAVPDAVLIVACEEECTFYAALKDRPWESWVERWAR